MGDVSHTVLDFPEIIKTMQVFLRFVVVCFSGFTRIIQYYVADTRASSQIRKIAGCTCTRNAGNVFATTAG